MSRWYHPATWGMPFLVSAGIGILAMYIWLSFKASEQHAEDRELLRKCAARCECPK